MLRDVADIDADLTEVAATLAECRVKRHLVACVTQGGEHQILAAMRRIDTTVDLTLQLRDMLLDERATAGQTRPVLEPS